MTSPPDPAAAPASRPGRMRNTAIFSAATGLSRIAGLVREIVAAAYFGTRVEASAFTTAFYIPNLLRALVADAALSAAFVPAFTGLLEQGRRREAIGLAGALFGVVLAALGLLTAGFVLVAPLVVPLFTGSAFSPAADALTVGLAQVMAPIVVLLGLNGLVVGILNAHEHFTVPALSALVWNVVIIAGLIAFEPLFEGPERVYAYALGVLAGTVVQFVMCLPVLRTIGFPLKPTLRVRGKGIGRILVLMAPVTLGLGLINFNLLINNLIATEISVAAPRAIDFAFRIYMLPQGLFSVAVATVIFPLLSRLAARGDLDGLKRASGEGLRQILLLLVPCAAAILVLSEPMVALVYEFGAFGEASTELVAEALFWFAFSLPLNGANLILTRTFFSLQKPWTPTLLSVGNLATNVVVALALYRPLGIAGIVIGSAAANVVMAVGQVVYLRRELGGFEVGRTLGTTARTVLASALLAATALALWRATEVVLGDGKLAQLAGMSVALAVGGAVYAAAVFALRVGEAEQVAALVRARMRGRTAS